MQGLRAVAWAWLLAAAVAKDIPQAKDDSSTIQARKIEIDQAVAKADISAKLAMDEARQEEEEEKAIELSVSSNPLPDSSTSLRGVEPSHPSAKEPAPQKVASPARDVGTLLKKTKEKKSKHKGAHFKELAMSRLRKAMEDKLRLKKEAHEVALKIHKAQVQSRKSTKASKKDVALKLHKAAQERLRKIAESKRRELARLKLKEAEAERKMAALKGKQAEEEKQLRKAKEEQMHQKQLKIEAEAQAKKREDQEHQRKLKIEAEERHQRELKIEAEAEAKKKEEQMHQRQLKKEAEAQAEAAAERQADETKAALSTEKEVALDAVVHKALLKKYGRKLANVKPEVLKRAEAKMKKLVKARLEKRRLSRLSHPTKADVKVAPAKVVVATAQHQTRKFDLDAFVKRMIDAKFKKFGVPVSKVREARLKEQMETKLKERLLAKHFRPDAKQLNPPHAAPDARATNAMVKIAKRMSKVEAADDTEDQQASDSQSTGEDADSETATDEQKDSAETSSQGTDDDEQKDNEQGTDDEQQTSDADQDQDEEAANSDAQGEDSEENEESDASSQEEDAEAFLQRARSLRQPILFSTEDADLQQYLHPVHKAPRVLTAKARRHRRLKGRHFKRVIAGQAGGALAGAPTASPAGSPGPSPGPAPAIDPYQMCDELCAYDTGMDGDKDMCVTECRTHVDAGGDLQSLKDFVTDETYNEKGGEKMEKHFEEKTGKEIPDCTPSLELDPNIKFDKVDANGDGTLTREEMDIWGGKACVPNELAHQIFDAADADFDEKVTQDEYNSLGEDTEIENILDDAADQETKGEDQYEPVQMPEFKHVDGNGDGGLDMDEIMKMFKMEIKKRIPNMPDADLDDLAAEHQQELMKDVQSVDDNNDGVISQEEYEDFHSEGMGKELAEAAAQDNNAPDPDDLSRDPTKKAGSVGEFEAQAEAEEKAAAAKQEAEDASVEEEAKAEAEKAEAEEAKGEEVKKEEEKKAEKASFLSREPA